MIQLLFLVLFAEGVVAFLLLVKIGPLRELVIKSLDQLKMGKGPATVKTIACTMSVILLSSFISIVKIQNKGVKLGTMSPMDQVLWRTHLLEASLMGRRMASLANAYPKLVRKETLLELSDLRFFQNHSSQMASLDYLVSLESDIFVPAYDGNMAKVVERHRRKMKKWSPEGRSLLEFKLTGRRGKKLKQ